MLPIAKALVQSTPFGYFRIIRILGLKPRPSRTAFEMVRGNEQLGS
jgi:hypothetical protein